MNKLFKGAVKLGVIAAAGAAAYHYLVPTETKAAMAEKVSDKLEDLSLALAEFEDSRPDDEDDSDEEDDWEDLSRLLDATSDEDDEDDSEEDSGTAHATDPSCLGLAGRKIDPEDHPTACLLLALAESLRGYAERKWDQAAEEEIRAYESRQ